MTTIRVYNGGGSIRTSVDLMIERLQSTLDADVRPIDASEIRLNMKWAKDADVILFAGATVRGFKKALEEDGLCNLYNSVAEHGLTYAGVCAGANLAVSRDKGSIVYDIVESGKKKRLEGEGLGFYDGFGKGPIKAIAGNRPHEDTVDDIHIIDVIRVDNRRSHKAVYWSGPLLIPKERGTLNGMFQASAFLKGTEIPLSVVGSHGNGRVVLYAHHPEITAWNWRRWVHAPNPTIFQQAKLNAMDAYLTGESFDGFIQDLGLDHIKTQTKKAGGLNLSAL